MGTEARVVVFAASEDEARRGAAAALDRIAELDRVMSDWKDDSELSALGKASGGAPQPVSDDLFRVLTQALAIADASEGAFDPTVGPIVRLWRDARRRTSLPDPADVGIARTLVGWRLVELAAGPPRTARLAKKGMRLDLGGIGKGFAAQEALAVLDGLGLRHALVAIAGDVVCGDAPPGRRGWDVAVGKTGESLSLARAAASTSGDAEQFVEIGGVRYSHVVDPRTGMGLTDSAWVTVTARDGATADALATAISVLGEEKGRALVARFGGARLVVFRR